MADPFLSEIRIMGFQNPPKGWAQCNGQFMPINQNQALFSLLGTTFGGNGQTTFALPDLRARVPIHVGNGFTLGQAGGEQSHTLTQSEMPMHQHLANATSAANATNTPLNTMLMATSTASQLYTSPSNLVTMDPTMLGNVGGSQAHQNMQPFLTLTFCIALIGIFPSPN